MSEALDTKLPAMCATRCAICGCEGNAAERWPATFDPEAFNARVFSARRLPDRVHYRMVACDTCGLVRSDPVAGEELLAGLYASSSFDYGEEVESIQATYGRALGRLEARAPRRDALLEIGCGNGFFLAQARRQGWQGGARRGAERRRRREGPARARRRDRAGRDARGLFAPESFDAVCLFQVLDHIPDPVELLEECLAVLRPGGRILAFNHNVSRVVGAAARRAQPDRRHRAHLPLLARDDARRLREGGLRRSEGAQRAQHLQRRLSRAARAAAGGTEVPAAAALRAGPAAACG